MSLTSFNRARREHEQRNSLPQSPAYIDPNEQQEPEQDYAEPEQEDEKPKRGRPKNKENA